MGTSKKKTFDGSSFKFSFESVICCKTQTPKNSKMTIVSVSQLINEGSFIIECDGGCPIYQINYCEDAFSLVYEWDVRQNH